MNWRPARVMFALVAWTAVAASEVPVASERTVDLTHPSPPLRIAECNAKTGLDFESTKVRYDLNKAALVIVDMQNFFVEPPSAPGRALIDNMNLAAATFRKANASVVWVNWGMRADYLDWPGRTAAGSHEWHPPQKGSHEAAIFSGLTTAASDIFVDKYRETGFYRSQLDDILRFKGLRTLFFGGVNTDQCVAGTMYDGARLGYDTALVTDLTATTSPHYAYEATLYNSQWTTTSADLIGGIAQAKGD